MDLYKFEASLVYKENSKPVGITCGEALSQRKRKKKKKKKTQEISHHVWISTTGLINTSLLPPQDDPGCVPPHDNS